MEFHKNGLWNALVDEEASTFAEYGLLFVLIALLVFLSALVVSGGPSELFQRTGEAHGGASVTTRP